MQLLKSSKNATLNLCFVSPSTMRFLNEPVSAKAYSVIARSACMMRRSPNPSTEPFVITWECTCPTAPLPLELEENGNRCEGVCSLCLFVQGDDTCCLLQLQDVVLPCLYMPYESLVCPRCSHKVPAVASCNCPGSPNNPLDLTTTNQWQRTVMLSPEFDALDNVLLLEHKSPCYTNEEDGRTEVQVLFNKMVPERYVHGDPDTGRKFIYGVHSFHLRWQPQKKQ